MSIQERIKLMQGGGQAKINPPKPAPAPQAQKRMSAAENLFKFNQGLNNDNKKEEKKVSNNNKVNDNKKNAFKDKLNMFANRGMMGAGRPRQSAQLNNVPNFGNLMKNKDSGIIQDNPDILKPGFQPSDELEKKLDVIVVQKDKKKKKKVNFQG